MINNIQSVVDDDLCCSCGACAEVCAREAISFSFERGLFVPKINDGLCVNCRQCVEVCPSAEVDVKAVFGDHELFTKEEKDCYIAFSKDNKLRHLGTSGGVISTLVSELLRGKDYGRAYVLSYDKFDGTQAKVSPITNPDDVQKTAKSKYIPASIAEVIKDIRNNTIGKAIVVGTPCQLLAVKQYLSLKKKEDSDFLFIGLFCDKTLNYNIYNYYSYKYGEYDSLHFRDKDGNNWPGDTVLVKDGKLSVVDKGVRMSLKPYFQLNRCRFCFDKLNQLADISCGDCYIEGEQSVEGKSSVVVRTEKGRMAVQKCGSVLEFKESSITEIKKSQHFELKKVNYLRNQFSKRAFVLPPLDVEMFGSVEMPSDDKELSRLRMGANACARNDFDVIDSTIKQHVGRSKSNKTMKHLRRFLGLFGTSDRTKKVLVDHAGFVNKGAELMLQSVVQQLEKNMPDARIVVPQDIFYENLDYCHKHQILPLQKVSGGKMKSLKHFVYDIILDKPWYITPDQIDVILDAGGFQFGDQWKPRQKDLIQNARYYSSFTKKSKKIVFLPQAFGPFELPLSKQLMRDVYDVADLIYAREQISLGFLNRLFSDNGKIKMAPDFTCLSEKSEQVSVEIPNEYVVIVPNVKMVTHTNSSVSSAYLDFMCGIARYLIDKGETVVLLNHEGKDDEKLLVEINRKLLNKAWVLSNLDALEVKKIIGGSKLLISSRFHGVVSGLTQGVPVLCTSWSHKYAELLKEHGCDNNILSVDDLEQAKDLIDSAMKDPQGYSSKEGRVDVIKDQANKMWEEIFGLIKN